MSGVFNKDWQTVISEKDERIAELEAALELNKIGFDAEIRHSEKMRERVRELETENERLRAECGLRQIHGYREGMERAAEMAVDWEQDDLANAIRAEMER